jgi:hypothetical protein
VAASFRWEIKPPGTDYRMTTDDFTLDEVESIEEQTQVPWMLLDPSNFKVARAMLIVAMIRAGIPDAEVSEQIKGWTVENLHGVFTLIPPRKTPVKPAKAGAVVEVPPTSASS